MHHFLRFTFFILFNFQETVLGHLKQEDLEENFQIFAYFSYLV